VVVLVVVLVSVVVQVFPHDPHRFFAKSFCLAARTRGHQACGRDTCGEKIQGIHQFLPLDRLLKLPFCNTDYPPIIFIAFVNLRACFRG
jgi:hypothetical protein